MAFGHNLTLFHRLYESAPHLGELTLQVAGRCFGISRQLERRLHCVYLHHVPLEAQERFVSELCDLAREARFIRTAEIPSALNAPTRPQIHLSFDDGVKDNHALGRRLAAAGIPAAFFVLPGYIESPPSGRNYYWEISPAQGLMDWEQIRELAELGHSIGSHALWHNRFVDLDDAAAAEEMRRSKEVIESRVGQPVDAFSFPFGRRGDFRSSQSELAWRLGYRFVFTTCPESPIATAAGWEVGRIGIDWRLRADALRLVMNGLLMRLRIVS